MVQLFSAPLCYLHPCVQFLFLQPVLNDSIYLLLDQWIWRCHSCPLRRESGVQEWINISVVLWKTFSGRTGRDGKKTSETGSMSTKKDSCEVGQQPREEVQWKSMTIQQIRKIFLGLIWCSLAFPDTLLTFLWKQPSTSKKVERRTWKEDFHFTAGFHCLASTEKQALLRSKFASIIQDTVMWKQNLG